ncbi:MAG TPA: hypothetical protein DCE23_07405 [Firmicutes bacterium]|nr:hypothetical protein [Bacillota bacterium]
MIKSRKELFDNLICEVGICTKCLNIKAEKNDKSLYNVYKDFNVGRCIPSIWTDWYNRLDAKIMVIGQDWGPYEDMLKLNKQYMLDKREDNWYKLIESEKSMTKKKLTKFLVDSSKGKISNIDNVFITNAIMCARSGTNYRGDNINLKYSTCACSNYLKRQIDIVDPKVIVTLGYYPLLALSNIFGFTVESNLTKTIENNPVIKVDNYIIVPAFHPAAQISLERQTKQYKKIWDNM